ncbi:glutathione S-transferase family protein [Altererythrobacter sp. SALINAS58]|uniref:glutathione S-transferase family protein n=1 Tax=Alteripontixanthobacter muriae TaxID=2705546 RepID=UPI0015752526|nr:glutathione S-transferase family protein [Alteripontixanthobacter muriae]NTZ41678.1 glutathione S-transferase family protein [Alteripontixanthobacter muriae]
MPQYTFFTNPMSRGQIVRWALHEVSADYETELVDWQDKSDRFIRANPMGKVPTLIHHDVDHVHVVTECAAICHYLAEMHPDVRLLAEHHEKADYFRLLFFAAGPVEQAATSKTMGWSVDDPQKQGMLGFGDYDRAMNSFEMLLADRNYVCGDRFTMADVYVGSQVDWGLQFGSIPSRPVFEKYAERLRDRGAYKQARFIDQQLIEGGRNS